MILFITGLLCTPIICCVGACLPLCDRRFKQGGEQCGWIANVVGSIVTSIITIVIIFVAAFGKRLGNVCFDDDNYYTCD